MLWGHWGSLQGEEAQASPGLHTEVAEAASARRQLSRSTDGLSMDCCSLDTLLLLRCASSFHRRTTRAPQKMPAPDDAARAQSVDLAFLASCLELGVKM